jgi:hypothetical protein
MGSGLLKTGAITVIGASSWSQTAQLDRYLSGTLQEHFGALRKWPVAQAKGLDGILQSCGRAATAKDQLYSRMPPGLDGSRGRVSA